ncbi:MAG: hypothetical protein M2R45_03973 [Verrucomicrobia subdivision 3 bacterium]|nr:hypothetical protein [Limisphaerales bacterium]MCS1415507.1 hypothetical protein [Limisphaerales bacterium]
MIDFFLIYDRTLKNKFEQELFLIVFPYLLASPLVGGLAILAYRAATTERDLV